MYCNKRYRYLHDLESANKIIEISKKYTEIVYLEEYNKTDFPLKRYTYIQDSLRYIYITSCYVMEKKTKNSVEYEFPKGQDKLFPCTWIFDKTGQSNFSIHPSRVAKIANKVYKPYDIIKNMPTLFNVLPNGKTLESARPILDYNPKFDRTEHTVFCYDKNSAYASILQDKIIDTYSFKRECLVGKNEVGFLLNDELTMIDKEGVWADFVFPLIDSPFKKFVQKYYNIKKNAPKGSEERQTAKDIINITVGIWQKHNPFLRAYIVNTCNKQIQTIVNKYADIICCWNTDAIYSVEDIPELKLSEEIGDFKLEYVGTFRQVGNNYQKVEEHNTVYRGVVKQVFKDNWNILTDELPPNELYYKYDYIEDIIKLNELFKEF